MKDTLKLVALAVISMGTMARSCIKTSVRVAEFSEPVMMEARYAKNIHTIENGIPVSRTVKVTKDMLEIAEKINNNKKDTVKNVKQKKAKRKMKK